MPHLPPMPHQPRVAGGPFMIVCSWAPPMTPNYTRSWPWVRRGSGIGGAEEPGDDLGGARDVGSVVPRALVIRGAEVDGRHARALGGEPGLAVCRVQHGRQGGAAEVVGPADRRERAGPETRVGA